MRSLLRYSLGALATFVSVLATSPAAAQPAHVVGSVKDETGGTLPGVCVQLRGGVGTSRKATTDEHGLYAFEGVAAGTQELVFGLVNFAGARRQVVVPGSGVVRVDVALPLALSADVTVTGKRTFTNLADAADPAQDLLGIAQSASQGAITARQLDARPVMRSGDVLETIPGVVISQHSGEGKANQYTLSKTVRIALDVFNLFDAKNSDIDYFYTSRLPGEPASGIADVHFHATLPRTVRLSLMLGF